MLATTNEMYFILSAVVLDRQYLGDKYQPILDELKDYIKELARVELQHGGVIVHYYSWTAINLKRGLTLGVMIENFPSRPNFIFQKKRIREEFFGI